MSTPSFGLRSKCLAELVGTYLLILLGCGVVHSAVLTGAQSGLWQVAVVWGLAIMLATAQGPYSTESHDDLNTRVSEHAAFLAEVLGTMILALVVFALTDERNAASPGARLAPVFIGLTVSALISVIAPLTQACFNPARDFGPRVFAFFAGWGEIALPGSRGTGFLTVYIVAPVVGALLGAQLYDRALRTPAEAVRQGRELEERPLSSKQQLEKILSCPAPPPGSFS